MHRQRLVVIAVTSAIAGTVAFAQVGRGGSQWRTALADAQRTSWVRTDDRISVDAVSKGGFELQWSARLETELRAGRGLGQGVTANGVTLFVPMAIVTASSNTVYGIDVDTGYVVWRRTFDAPLTAPAPGCPGGITAAGTRIVSLGPAATASARSTSFGGGGAGFRSLLGEPGEGVPVEGRVGGGRSGDPGGAPAGRRGAAPAAGQPGAGRAGAPSGAARDAASNAPARGAGRGAGAPPPAAGRGIPPEEHIPGAPPPESGGPYGFLFRPSGVSYVVSSDGMLHVLGLPSGKDMQRPAPFVPANSRWSAPIAIGTTMYAATGGGCGGTPDGVWAIDLESDAKPVVSWKTNGGPVVGAVAFTSDGTLIAAIGAGAATGEGKANAIVALDPKTLQLKDWFTNSTAEFVTGPTIVSHGGREIIAAATKDGRVLLLDARAPGGRDHATPLVSSKPLLASGATVSADALAAWQQQGAASAPASAGAAAAAEPASAAAPATSWILLPVNGRLAAGTPAANGAIATGAVLALQVRGTGEALSLDPVWASHDLAAPGTPLVVNGVVFTLATGASRTEGSAGTPAVLRAYEGSTGKALWSSGTAMGAPASPGSFWSAMGQVYVGARDGTLYAFGFNDERRPTNGN